MPQEQGMPEDPLDLEAVDRAIRRNELAERGRELGDGDDAMYVSEDCPPDEHDEFLRTIKIIEDGPFTTRFEQLEKAGVDLPRPEALDDAALSVKLWEVINALAARDVYLYRTDHLSDRELYEELWGDALREPTADLPPGSGWVGHIDMIGSGSVEDLEIGLRYYETEEERRRWAEEFPDDTIPPHQDPPYDRDRHLPKSEG